MAWLSAVISRKSISHTSTIFWITAGTSAPAAEAFETGWPAMLADVVIAEFRQSSNGARPDDEDPRTTLLCCCWSAVQICNIASKSSSSGDFSSICAGMTFAPAGLYWLMPSMGPVKPGIGGLSNPRDQFHP